MSEAATKALIVRYLTALNAGDHEAALALVSEDVVHDTPMGAREVGRDKVRWHLGLQARHFREELSDIAIMVGEGGGRAAAEFTVRGTYLATAQGMPEANGQRYSLMAGMFFEVDDGRFSRVTSYRNRQAWIEALA